jgi:hypothetical protein
VSHPLKTITVAALLAIALFALGIRWYSDRAVSTPPSAARATAANPDALPARAEATPRTSATAAPGGVEPPAALPARRSASNSFMPELRQAADAGDPVAACRLAVALGRCSDMKRIELGASLGEGVAPGSPVSSLASPPANCRGASALDLDDRYRYQAQVFASGNAAAERWFVQQPMLSEYDFKANTPNAIDFRRRAPAYVAHALQRRSLDDLKVLLQVYMPPGYFESDSPLRIRDDAMFLALADIAEQARVSPEYIRTMASRVRQTAGSDVLARSRQSAAQAGGPWQPAQAVDDGASAVDAGDAICSGITRR